MEKKELREQYYKAVEKTIGITMDGFENLSDDFEKIWLRALPVWV